MPGTRSACTATVHENPVLMTPQQEEDVLDKSIELVERLSGKYPRGYVAPWWELSPVTVDLLIKKGIKYDHSLMHNDFYAVLRAHRRHLDQDRLFKAGRRTG